MTTDDDALDRWLDTATIEQKCALLAGRDFWSTRGIDDLDVTSIVLTDGPHGVRLQSTSTEQLGVSANRPATCFPTAATLGSTWDPEMVRRVGVALGVESRSLGVSVLLGPGANIKRNPLCGRNFEYFSEDPLLSSAMASSWVRGVQSEGVGASLKHFAVNNQETLRYSVDAVVDERALREVYLASFERAVRGAEPLTVMAAYNRVNGEYATEHPTLLQRVLRDEWGFDGLVMSDWGATNDRVAGLLAGLDLQMPGMPDAADPLVDAIREGTLDGHDLDVAIRRLVALVRRTAAARRPAEVDVEAHHRLAEEVAAAGSVLLTNDGVLPLAPGTRIAVIGDFAVTPRFQGAGSSVVNARRVVAAYDAISQRAAAVTYAPGYDRYADEPDAGLLEQARQAAADADVAVVFVGLPEVFETEGADRADMRLPASHDELVAVVAAANPRTVVVLSNGAPVEMPWVPRVAAVLEAYLGGQESGGAVARMLFGDLEPGGRLAETFPMRWTDHPVHDLPSGPRYSEYRESVYVGYRWFDTVDADVAFPFGHGLGYTTSAWSDVTIEPVTVAAGEAVTVRVTVTNTGQRAGSDVVQVYVRPVAAPVFRPAHELAAFRKVRLGPGEETTVTLTLDARAFSYWSPTRAGWVAAPGEYDVEVAASSRDVRGTVRVTLTGDPHVARYAGAAGVDATRQDAAERHESDVPDAYARPRRGQWFDRPAFEALLGHPLGPNVPDAKGGFTVNTPLAHIGRSRVSAWLRTQLAARFGGQLGTDPVAQVMVRRTVEEAPPRMLRMFGNGRISRAAVDAFVATANGRPGEAARILRESRRR